MKPSRAKAGNVKDQNNEGTSLLLAAVHRSVYLSTAAVVAPRD